MGLRTITEPKTQRRKKWTRIHLKINVLLLPEFVQCLYALQCCTMLHVKFFPYFCVNSPSLVAVFLDKRPKGPCGDKRGGGEWRSREGGGLGGRGGGGDTLCLTHKKPPFAYLESEKTNPRLVYIWNSQRSRFAAAVFSLLTPQLSLKIMHRFKTTSKKVFPFLTKGCPFNFVCAVRIPYLLFPFEGGKK